LKKIIEKKFRGSIYEITRLDSEYGPTVVDDKVEALVISRETARKGYDINEIRYKNGLKPLTIIIIDIIRAEDGNPISSTRIRAGEIDTSGKLLKVK
jgi:pantetheine-phosphate adenylyltransferase